jgi:hypothetical protein
VSDREDYYQILGVDSDASPEEIKHAFRKKALDYHPDRLAGVSESVRRLAGEEMKKLNLAYEVLKDPLKRRQYDSIRAIPKPVVDPLFIHFSDVEPGEIKRASFIIRNHGGSYNKLRIIYDPNSWVRVVHYESLTDSDELPLRVEIEAKGETWKKKYLEYIKVKLDEEETQVKIDLQTKPEPIREKVQPKRTPTARPAPSPSPGFPISGKWIFGAISIVAIAIITIFILMNGRVQSDRVQPGWNYQTVGYQLWSVAISSDGRFVAAGGGGFILNKDNKIIMRGDTVYLFDQDGDLLWNYDETGGEVYSVAITPDGRYAAAGSGHWGNNNAYLFNHKGDLLWNHQIGGDAIHSVAISSDGRYVAVGSGLNDGNAYLFNHKGDLLWKHKTGGIVKSVAISVN